MCWSSMFPLHHQSDVQICCTLHTSSPSRPKTSLSKKTLLFLDKLGNIKKFKSKSEIFWPRIKIFCFEKVAPKTPHTCQRHPTHQDGHCPSCVLHLPFTRAILSHETEWPAMTSPTHGTQWKVDVGWRRTPQHRELFSSPSCCCPSFKKIYTRC